MKASLDGYTRGAGGAEPNGLGAERAALFETLIEASRPPGIPEAC